MTNLAETAREAVDTLARLAQHPYGPETSEETQKVLIPACIALAGGDQDKARSLWKEITRELGYMPHASAVALIWASRAYELMPDVEAPEVG